MIVLFTFSPYMMERLPSTGPWGTCWGLCLIQRGGGGGARVDGVPGTAPLFVLMTSSPLGTPFLTDLHHLPPPAMCQTSIVIRQGQLADALLYPAPPPPLKAGADSILPTGGAWTRVPPRPALPNIISTPESS